MTDRQSHTRFRLVSKSTTLDDLEGPLRTVSKRVRLSEPGHHENLNEDRLYCQRRRFSQMTLDPDNIRFMRIFAGVLWKGGVIQQWGNRKRVCRAFGHVFGTLGNDANIIKYYLVPCRLSTDPKIRDLE